MGLPTVVASHPVDASIGKIAPLLLVDQDRCQRPGNVLGIRGFDQNTVAAVGHDIHRPAVVGGHDRQTAGRGLDQGDAERLHQRRVDENAMALGTDPVKLGDLGGEIMLFGNRQLTVKIVMIHLQQHIGEHLALVFFHGGDVAANACKNGQVGDGLQLRAGAVRLDQAADILAVIGPAQRQDKGFVGVDPEAVQFSEQGYADLLDFFAEQFAVELRVIKRIESIQVDTGRDHGKAIVAAVVVEAILLIDFLPGRGDNQFGPVDDFFLNLDPGRHLVLAVYSVFAEPFPEEFFLLASAQRMTGEDKVRVKGVGQPHRNIARIGIVAVKHIRGPRLRFDKSNHPGDELFQVRPEQLLSDVLFAAELHAHDTDFVRDLLDGLAVVFGYRLVVYQPGHQINLGDLIAFTQGPGQFQHIFDLAAGVGITAQFGGLRANQPVNAEELNVETLLHKNFSPVVSRRLLQDNGSI